jgi:hypothetical protein
MHMSTLSIAPFISMYVRYSDYVFMSANDSVLSMYFTLRYVGRKQGCQLVCLHIKVQILLYRGRSSNKHCKYSSWSWSFGIHIGYGRLVYILVMVVSYIYILVMVIWYILW